MIKPKEGISWWYLLSFIKESVFGLTNFAVGTFYCLLTVTFSRVKILYSLVEFT